jgi:hypothetical protein
MIQERKDKKVRITPIRLEIRQGVQTTVVGKSPNSDKPTSNDLELELARWADDGGADQP